MHSIDVPAIELATSSAAPAWPVPLEVELKFAIAPDTARKLAALPEVKQAAAGRALTRRMHSVYYDTPERSLLARGMGLRLRREGGRWIQSLKSAGVVEGGLHRREEREIPVPVQLPDYSALAQWGLADLVTDPAERGRLQPMFRCEFTRTARRLVLAPGSEIELCFDRGALLAVEANQPLSEIELEVKAGEPQALIDFALRLLERLPLRLEARSKAQRGYALLDARAAQPVKARAPALSPELSVSAALRDIVFGCVAQLQANEAGLLAGGDPEYLHQARVALRRLRSAFSLFRRAVPRAACEDVLLELRWLGEQLGAARDWDVLALDTLPRVARGFANDAGMRALLQRAQALRACAAAQALEAVGSRRYTALLLRLNSLFLREPWRALPDEPAAQLRGLPLREFVADVLARHHRKVTKLGRKHARLGSKALDATAVHAGNLDAGKVGPGTAGPGSAGPGSASPGTGDPGSASPGSAGPGNLDPGNLDPGSVDPGALHQLRIEIKKLRYAAEFFSALYPRKPVRAYTAALAALQELLGGLNDAATVERLCAIVRDGGDPAQIDAAGHEAIGALRGWAAATAHDHLAQLPRAWKRFRAADPFW